MHSILIVDDEAPIAEGLAELIATSSLPLTDVKIAYSAAEALKLFHRSPFDIVLSDIHMPEMDGIAFFQEIRRLWPQARLIFLTGYSNFDYAREAIHLGVSDFLLKPADDEEVLACLRKTIEDITDHYPQRIEANSISANVSDDNPLLRWLLARETTTPPPLPANMPPYPFTLATLRVDRRGRHAQIPLLASSLGNILRGSALVAYEPICLPSTQDRLAILLHPSDTDILSEPVLIKTLEETQDILYTVLETTVSFAFRRDVSLPELPNVYQLLLSRLEEEGGEARIMSGSAGESPDITPESDALSDSNPSEPIIASIRSYIDNNIAQDLSLGSLSRKFRVNPSYLSRLFHQMTGERLSEYITQRKVRIAKQLLETDDKIYAVARQVGYDNPNYFSKVFKKTVGITPQEYRMLFSARSDS